FKYCPGRPGACRDCCGSCAEAVTVVCWAATPCTPIFVSFGRRRKMEKERMDEAEQFFLSSAGPDQQTPGDPDQQMPDDPMPQEATNNAVAARCSSTSPQTPEEIADAASTAAPVAEQPAPRPKRKREYRSLPFLCEVSPDIDSEFNLELRSIMRDGLLSLNEGRRLKLPELDPIAAVCGSDGKPAADGSLQGVGGGGSSAASGPPIPKGTASSQSSGRNKGRKFSLTREAAGEAADGDTTRTRYGRTVKKVIDAPKPPGEASAPAAAARSRPGQARSAAAAAAAEPSPMVGQGEAEPKSKREPPAASGTPSLQRAASVATVQCPRSPRLTEATGAAAASAGDAPVARAANEAPPMAAAEPSGARPKNDAWKKGCKAGSTDAAAAAATPDGVKAAPVDSQGAALVNRARNGKSPAVAAAAPAAAAAPTAPCAAKGSRDAMWTASEWSEARRRAAAAAATALTAAAGEQVAPTARDGKGDKKSRQCRNPVRDVAEGGDGGAGASSSGRAHGSGGNAAVDGDGAGPGVRASRENIAVGDDSAAGSGDSGSAPRRSARSQRASGRSGKEDYEWGDDDSGGGDGGGGGGQKGGRKGAGVVAAAGDASTAASGAAATPPPPAPPPRARSALDAFEEKIAAALAGQILRGTPLADEWVQCAERLAGAVSFAAAAAAAPTAAIALSDDADGETEESPLPPMHGPPLLENGSLLGSGLAWDRARFVVEDSSGGEAAARDAATADASAAAAGAPADAHAVAAATSAADANGRQEDALRKGRGARAARAMGKEQMLTSLANGALDQHSLVAPLRYASATAGAAARGCFSGDGGSGAGARPAGAARPGPAAQPFAVLVHPTAAFTCDFHAHLCDSEVIGILAGWYDNGGRALYVQGAFPCVSTERSDDGSTDVEIDGVSQMKTVQLINSLGLKVVGWYHSHPTFQPDPSVVDIENHSNYQV
ncbi:unnamed protein product, partial [Phaeothamnion confervicola]